MKTNLITGDDKNARISDVETFSLVATNSDNILKEFLGPRADDSVAKQEMAKKIYRDGYVALQDLSSDLENKQSINYLDVLFTGAGIKTDLVTPTMHLRSSLNKKEQRDLLSSKYDK